MNIPQKAIDAAIRALFEDGCGEPKVDAITAIEAALPFIAEQELREHADYLNNAADLAREDEHVGIHEAADLTHKRADEIGATL